MQIEISRDVSSDELAVARALPYLRSVERLAFDWSDYVRQTSKNISLHLFRFNDENDASVSGAALLYVVKDFAPGNYLPSPLNEALSWAERLRLRPLLCKAGFLEIPLLNASGCCFTKLPSCSQLRRLVRHIVDWARQELDVALLCIRSEETPWEKEVYAALGLTRIPTYPSARLTLPYSSFVEYKASLTRNQRKDLRRKSNLLRRAGGEIEPRDRLGDRIDDIFPLFQKTQQHNRGKSLPLAVTVGREFFRSLDELANPQPRHLLVVVDGRVVAFTTSLRAGDLLISKFTGMDYSTSKATCAYFNLYYEEIRWAIESGIEEIDFGVTSEESKANVGCTMEPRAYWVAFFHPALRLLSRAFVRAFQGHP